MIFRYRHVRRAMTPASRAGAWLITASTSPRANIQGNTAAGRDELDVGAGLRPERGQHHVEQPGVVDAGGRRERDAMVLRRRETRGSAQT